jgi:hypothetical protein
VVLLGCRDGDGNTFIVDKHAERLWLPQRHAAAIKAMIGRWKMGDRRLELSDLKRFVAGADVFSRQGDGTTIAGQYLREGITLRPASMDRVNGSAAVLQGLGDHHPAEVEGIVIISNRSDPVSGNASRQPGSGIGTGYRDSGH